MDCSNETSEHFGNCHYRRSCDIPKTLAPHHSSTDENRYQTLIMEQESLQHELPRQAELIRRARSTL
jgi:hypothetical protein